MFSHHAGQWRWAGRPLSLSAEEAALLAGMLRECGRRRAPHVWLAYELHEPHAPAAGVHLLRSLRRKLAEAGAPERLVEFDPVEGAAAAADAPRAADEETNRILRRPAPHLAREA